MAAIALIPSVLISCRTGEASPPPTPPRAISQPVMLVPITAPMMTASAWRSFIIMEFTKPTAMTLVADEDWITAVTPAPSKMPLSGVPDSLYRISSSLLPATFFRLSPISDIPYRNSATPPRSLTTSVIFIFPPSARFLLALPERPHHAKPSLQANYIMRI